MKRLFKYTLIIFFSIGILIPALVGAQNSQTPEQAAKQQMDKIKNQAKSLNQLPSTINSPQAAIGFAIQILMMFMGAIMFLLVVYGGVIWMTASGNSEKIAQAKNIIIWAALGVSVMLASYVVVTFVFDKLANGT